MCVCVNVFVSFSWLSCSDTLYRLSFSLEPYEKSVWEAPDKIMETCQSKGPSDTDCRNYIMVLQNYGNRLYACGTYAFSPYCSWRQVRVFIAARVTSCCCRSNKNTNILIASIYIFPFAIALNLQMDNLNDTEFDKGVAKCPFNPHANITTLMTENGKLFVGSPTDFSGTDPAILRADVAKVWVAGISNCQRVRPPQQVIKCFSVVLFLAERWESHYSHRSIQFAMVEFAAVRRQFRGRWIRLFYIPWAGCRAHQLRQGKCAHHHRRAKTKRLKPILRSFDRLFIRASHVSAKTIQVATITRTTVGQHSWRLDWIARCPANIHSISMKCKASSIRPKKAFCMRHFQHQSKYLRWRASGIETSLIDWNPFSHTQK